MKGTLIKNTRLISPGLDLEVASILLEHGKIKDIYCAGSPLPDTEKVYDATAQITLPGFIDIHSHGAMGYDVTDGTLKAMETIGEAKLREGVTTFCPTTLTLPKEDLIKTMDSIAAYLMGLDLEV